MSVNFQLVKMDGDWVARPPWYRLDLWARYRLQGKNVMPTEPRNHPACAEIIESVGDSPARVVYQRK